jgi:hypothetical protein
MGANLFIVDSDSDEETRARYPATLLGAQPGSAQGGVASVTAVCSGLPKGGSSTSDPAPSLAPREPNPPPPCPPKFRRTPVVDLQALRPTAPQPAPVPSSNVPSSAIVPCPQQFWTTDPVPAQHTAFPAVDPDLPVLVPPPAAVVPESNVNPAADPLDEFPRWSNTRNFRVEAVRAGASYGVRFAQRPPYDRNRRFGCCPGVVEFSNGVVGFCPGTLTRKEARAGRNRGRTFFGCTKYNPNGNGCSFTTGPRGIIPYGEVLNFSAEQRLDARQTYNDFRMDLPRAADGSVVYSEWTLQANLPSPYPSGTGPCYLSWTNPHRAHVQEIREGALQHAIRAANP